MNTDPATLLRDFLATRSEAAFSDLVRAQIDLVYSAARRICAGDTHLAEDITQTVFADLARKAARLPGDVVLSAWLYRHTFFVASSMIRTERRRRAREQEAVAMNATHEAAEPDWALLAPHLDEAMNALVEADRRALVLRYFDKLDLRAVGERLGVSEDTAQKRVARALERLKTRFAKKGVSVSLTALAASLLAHAVSAAPAVLTAQTASAVVAGFVAGSGILIALEKFMTLNALKPIAAALAVAGVATPLFLQHQSLAAARDQTANLGAQVAELADLRAENERLGKLAVDFRELERLRAEHLELMRLRGEATLMRNELAALRRDIERQRELLRIKGVRDEELLSETERESRRQIIIETRVAEVPLNSGLWTTFGLARPTDGDQMGKHTTMTVPAARLLIRLLEMADTVKMVFSPQITTLNGRQAQVRAVHRQTVVTDREGDQVTTQGMELRPIMDVIAAFDPGEATVNVQAVFAANRLLGYADEPGVIRHVSNGVVEEPLPQTPDVRRMEVNISVRDSEYIVLAGGYSRGTPNDPTQQPTGLIVLISPTEIHTPFTPKKLVQSSSASSDKPTATSPASFAPVSKP